MSVQISITIDDGKKPLSSLGKAARLLSKKEDHECEHNSECDECDLEKECGSCGNCLHCAGSCPECGEEEDCGTSSLGAKAKELSGKSDPMGVFDLKKKDLGNEYAAQETTGERRK